MQTGFQPLDYGFIIFQRETFFPEAFLKFQSFFLENGPEFF